MILEYLYQTHGNGYIAGEKDGIVTVGGVPASRQICVFDIKTLAWVQSTISNKNGNYLLMGLDPTKKYLLMARDYKGEYEPCCWDFVVPMNDKTIDEQRELWQSWQ